MGDSMKFTATARSLGIFSAAATVILLVAYAVTLAVGLLSLESPQQPIGDPMFTLLEVLIISMMPAMVTLMFDLRHLHGPTRRGDQHRTLRHPDLEPPARVQGAFVAAAGPIVQLALGRIRSRHPRLGRLLPALDIVCRPSLLGESPCDVDPRADDCQRSARARRLERSRGQRHAAAKHRHRRLRRGVSPRGNAAGCLIL